jgi:YidC/Oxa1 family membrane protein insertase
MNPENEKRFLTAVVLTFVLLMAWRYFFLPSKPLEPPVHQTVQPSGKVETSSSPTPQPVPVYRPRVKLPRVAGSRPQDIVIASRFYRVTLSTQGAVVKNWILNKYKDRQGKSLEVVNTQACAQFGYPMSISLADSALADQLNSAVYVVQRTPGALTSPAQVTFTYSNGKVQVRKVFSFGKAYEVNVSVTVFDGQHDLPVFVNWPGDVGDQSLPIAEREKFSRAFYDQGTGIKTVPQSKVNSEESIPGPLVAAGVEDHFFAGIFIPESPQDVFRFVRETWRPPNWTEKALPQALMASLGTPASEPLRFRLSAVPKSVEVLRAENPALEKLVDFGIMAFVAKPLLLAMHWTYDHIVRNWGWVIILLTIVLNMIFFPLKIKSVRSAQEMQKIAPLMKEIQNRYKQYKMNDPRRQRMNQEIMKLYQEHGINPLGGCLPMLPQLPIFWGFYELLENSISLRHAPWLWWIKDLAAPDPLYILPTLGIVVSLIMYKMTPVPSADPAQQRMMMFMPIFVGIIFYRLPAGATLYYLTLSIVGIGQQLWINRMAPPAKGQAQTPPATGHGKGSAPPPPASGGRPQRPGWRRPVTVKGA